MSKLIIRRPTIIADEATAGIYVTFKGREIWLFAGTHALFEEYIKRIKRAYAKSKRAYTKNSLKKDKLEALAEVERLLRK